MSYNINSLAEGTAKLTVSIIEPGTLIELAKEAQTIFEKEPILLEIEPPCNIVGDLHGHLLDLYRILTTCDLPPATKYLFLGDIVDRGQFSIECITLVYVLKVLYPQSIYVVRGNHEFKHTSMFGGFFSEVNSVYSNAAVFDAFANSFQYIPIAAKINNILCLHAGISPDVVSLDQIRQLERPILECEVSLLVGILWSDPTMETNTFIASRRGTGFLFGLDPLVKFLENNNLKCLIRGHQCVNGSEYYFGEKILTVFSASNYCGTTGNNAGFVQVLTNDKIIVFSLPPLPYLLRSSTNQVYWKNELIKTIARPHSMNQLHMSDKTLARSETGLNENKRLNITHNSSSFFQQNSVVIPVPDRTRYKIPNRSSAKSNGSFYRQVPLANAATQ